MVLGGFVLETCDMTVTVGHVDIAAAGLSVQNGIRVTTAGVYVEAGGLSVYDGMVVESGDMLVDEGHVNIAAGNVNILTGGLSVQNIGRASTRERVCQYGEISVVAVMLKEEDG